MGVPNRPTTSSNPAKASAIQPSRAALTRSPRNSTPSPISMKGCVL
jgi:hypothetical protein